MPDQGCSRTALETMAEAPVTFETEAVIDQIPDIADLVPSEAIPAPSVSDPAGPSTFPKVLRRRLEKFFADNEHLSQS